MMRRISKELKSAPREGDVIFVGLIDDDPRKQMWSITPQAGGTLAFNNIEIKVVVTLPVEYPFKEPRVVIPKTIFHPNFVEGITCLTDKWEPTITVLTLLQTVKNIIMHPRMNAVLCADAGTMFSTDLKAYVDEARRRL